MLVLSNKLMFDKAAVESRRTPNLIDVLTFNLIIFIGIHFKKHIFFYKMYLYKNIFLNLQIVFLEFFVWVTPSKVGGDDLFIEISHFS